MATSFLHHLRDFCRDERAVAASEFGLVLPLMIVLLFGTVELGNVLLLDKKVTAASQTAADLIAQQKVVTGTDIDNIWEAIDNILAPYGVGSARYTVLSVVADEDANQAIDWQDTRGGGEIEEITIPAGLLGANESVIVAMISYDYSPVFGDLLFTDFTISDVSYLRPRTVDAVDFQ